MSVCYGANGLPEPCGGWNIYDSYTTDPRYQRYFTLAWTATLAFVLLLRVPAYISTLAIGWAARNEPERARGGPVSWYGLLGIYEAPVDGYTSLEGEKAGLDSLADVRAPRWTARTGKLALTVSAVVHAVSRVSPPIPSFLARALRLGPRTAPSCHPPQSYLPFSLGDLAVVLLIPAFVLATLLPESQLRANPNRFGFLALACLPPVFALSVKAGPVAWILGRGWTAVNFLHRWLGRMMVLLVLLHFYFWTVQYSGSAQTTFLAGEKERRGITALAFLLVIVLSSLPPMRRFSYPVFFTLHYVGLVGFLVSVNRHTVYAGPWATYAIIGIYASDILARIASYRVRWVEAAALGGGMVKLSMPGVAGGWRGGQHLSVRLFFLPPTPSSPSSSTSGWRHRLSVLAAGVRGAVRPFESHPLSIATAPVSQTLSPSSDRGIELYARSCGRNTWTGDLYRYVRETAEPLPLSTAGPAPLAAQRKVYLPCLLEGPYGGIPLHESAALLEDSETVVLVAGGSGMSFTLGVLESIVGTRTRRGTRAPYTGRIEVVWVVRQRAHLGWFADRLDEVARAAVGTALRVVVRTYVTCDETLTSEAPAPASDSAESSGAGTPAEGAAAAGESAAPLALEIEAALARLALRATVSYVRPSLRDLVRESVDRALAPCGHCFPVCRCGELAAAAAATSSAGNAGSNGSGAGYCANDEEECVGGCGGVANARELVVGGSGGDGGGADAEKAETEKGKEVDTGAEVLGEMPTLTARAPRAAERKGCCSSGKEPEKLADNEDDGEADGCGQPGSSVVPAGTSSSPK
ncbi:ferric-chelate reductase Frp1 [Rhodotorula sphaerocarpa]